MPLRAVLFDVGETLVHPAPSFPELFSIVVDAEGHRRTPDAVIDASRAVFHRFSEAARDVELWTTSPVRSARFWKGVYERMLRELNIPDDGHLADVLYATFTDPANYALFDDVEPTLDELETGGLVLAIVSNFEAWLEDLLGTLGVRNRFGVRVISGREGMEKPDPRIFELALERLALAASDAMYVGDNPEFDVAPTAALGMTPVLIDRRDRYPDAECTRIRDLRELPSLVRAVA
ncbi:MAG TPA: HAD-IA family hydrolase [Actinomycetota bacterium]|jgi:putative hydrolase of the HAD superfamily|nr:HAD-IA family hydrolase [Actinomycetota bacterium]